MNLALDAGTLVGVLLAMTRVAAFVVVSPFLARTLPVVARSGVVIVLGVFLAEPVPGGLGIGALLGFAVTNAAVGAALGYLTGLLLHLFSVAGSVVDATSGLSVAALLDPISGESNAVFGRLFSLTALTVFLVAGGLQRVVHGLALSVEAIPLDGSVAADAGLVDLAVRLTSQLVVAGVELALPVVAALFGVEIVMGIAARFAPQMNVFLLGFPLKILAALSLGGVVLLLYPEATAGLIDRVGDVFVEGIQGLRPDG